MSSTSSQLVIDPQLTEPTDIYNALQTYILAQPDTARWNDFYGAGAGANVARLVAALGGFDSFNTRMVQREQSRLTAELPSSIRDHAFNAGILESPGSTYGLVYSFQVTPGVRVTLSEGDIVAQLGTYMVYSLDNIDTGDDFTLRVAVGLLETVTRPVNGRAFALWEYDLSQPYIADVLERLTVDGVEIPLRDTPGDLSERGNNFLLRQVSAGIARIFVGNGVLGWNNPTAQQSTYRYLNYGDDLASYIGAQPNLLTPSGVRLVQTTVTSSPVYGTDPDELKGLTLYYPQDGKVVSDSDYQGIILKNFGGVLDDVYSYNTDPDQHVRLLVNSRFDPATHIPAIQRLIDGKRGPAIQVFYDVVPEGTGTNIDLSFRVSAADYVRYLTQRDAIIKFLGTHDNTFVREATTITTADTASDLTRQFGITFYAVGAVSYSLNPGDYISSYNVQINNPATQ